MMKKRTFISFDYDNDVDLKNMLVGQSRNTDSPFEITDMSIKETIDRNWKENARRRIKSCDVVVIMCGTKTDSAIGVSEELRIAQEENISYFCLRGRSDRVCVFPKGTQSGDTMHDWTWNNLKQLFD